MTLRLHYACCNALWTGIREENEQSQCPTCGQQLWPAEMYEVEKTEAGWQNVMPGYAPPSTRERVQLLASLPYSHRKSRAEKAPSNDARPFDVEGRSQLDWLDIKAT